MANQLKKVTSVVRTPAVAATPYIPAFCSDTPVYATYASFGQTFYLQQAYLNKRAPTGARSAPSLDFGPTTDFGAGKSFQPILQGSFVRYIYRTCYPAVRSVPGRPARVTYAQIPGWNSGGRSVQTIPGAGYVEFSVGPYSIGVIAGISSRVDTASPGDCSHAFFFSITAGVSIYENGADVTALPGVTASQRFRISRSTNGVVTYYVDDVLKYTSLVTNAGVVALDVSLYMSSDYVYDPFIGAVVYGAGRATAGARGVYHPEARVIGRAGVRTPSARGRIGANSYAAGVGRAGVRSTAVGYTAFFGAGVGTVGVTATARVAENVSRGRTKAFVGVASDRETYAFSAGVYAPEMYLYSSSGAPVINVAYAIGLIPPVIGFTLGYNGSVGYSDATTPSFAGIGADRTPYSYSAGVYRVRPVLAAFDALTSPDALWHSDAVFTESTMAILSDIWATFVSTVDVTDGVLLEIELSAGVEWLDAILASSAMSVLSDADATFASSVAVSSQNAHVGSGIQYATNLATNAITRYDAFDFMQLLSTSAATFGLKADGVYLIGGSASDSGSSRDAFVDVGNRTFGAHLPKQVEAVFFGLTTDGLPLAVIARDDGLPRVYTVKQRAHFMRTDPGKGAPAKRWKLRLEVHNATQAELDSVEFVVKPTTRRWIK